jgi:hypothetical protein
MAFHDAEIESAAKRDDSDRTQPGHGKAQLTVSAAP